MEHRASTNFSTFENVELCFFKIKTIQVDSSVSRCVGMNMIRCDTNIYNTRIVDITIESEIKENICFQCTAVDLFQVGWRMADRISDVKR